MRSKPEKFFLVLIIALIFQTVVSAQESKMLKFSDDSEFSVINNFYGKEITSIKVIKKEAIGELNIKNIGKATGFGDNIYSNLKKDDASLVKKLKKITTAFTFTQNGEEFYINTFSSTDKSKLQKCIGCKVSLKLIILEICSGSDRIYVPIIESITPL